jgi:uncharacterized membrane protein
MAVVLALSASLLYGAADFLGGLASRRQAVLAVVVASQAAGVLGLLAVLPFLPAAAPRAADLGLGALGGLAGAVAVVCLYRGLAEGRMSVVAPVAALSGLALPVAGGLAMGERPGTLALAGMALSGLAVWLLGRGPADAAGTGPGSRRALWLALASGAAGGAFYVLLQRTSPDAGAWPLVAGRAASLTVLVTVTGWNLAALKPASPRLLVLMVAAGLLDTAANAFYLWASKHGLLSVVATLASLYPASTVLLARLTLRERLEPGQRAGRAVGTLALPLLVGR